MAFSASALDWNSTSAAPMGTFTFLSRFTSTLVTVPYTPKISSRCAGTTFRVRFLTTTVLISGLGDLDFFLAGDLDPFLGDFDPLRGDLERLGDFEPLRGDLELFLAGDFFSFVSVFLSRLGDFDFE